MQTTSWQEQKSARSADFVSMSDSLKLTTKRSSVCIQRLGSMSPSLSDRMFAGEINGDNKQQ